MYFGLIQAMIGEAKASADLKRCQVEMQAARRRSGMPAGDIIDVEAREVFDVPLIGTAQDAKL